MGALADVVRAGKALYVGISSYPPDLTRRVEELLKGLGTKCLIHQPKYSMLVRDIEHGLLDTVQELGIGCIVFSPLAQGLLTDRYFRGIPKGSRATKPGAFLRREQVTEAVRKKAFRLNEVARARGQSLAQMALAWTLRHASVTSTLIGASRPAQVEDAVGALAKLAFSGEELGAIDRVLSA
jgi:L-glyceraldehyde 3-phosphate reductase